MKIAISANGETNESILDARFGRCEYFQIHDTEKEEVEILENLGKCANYMLRLWNLHASMSTRCN